MVTNSNKVFKVASKGEELFKVIGVENDSRKLVLQSLETETIIRENEENIVEINPLNG